MFFKSLINSYIIHRSIVLKMAEEELKNLKEAIIDLYLAIKIRSTEEVIYIFLFLKYNI